MKRYCQTLELRDDREMIEKYVEAHAHVWPEIQGGIRSVVSSTCRFTCWETACS